MKKAEIGVSIFTFILFVGCLFVQAQQTAVNPPTQAELDRKSILRQQEIDRINNKLGGKNDMGMIIQPKKERTSGDAKTKEKWENAEREKLEIINEINQKVSAGAEYYQKYAGFLKEKNTGIARMFPDKNCGEGKTVTVQELERCGDTPQIKGGGSLFSVRLNEIPAYLPLQSILFLVGQSDMHLVGDRFFVGNETTQDIIAEIGDVNFDEITPKSEAFKFLTEFKPSKTKTEFKLQKTVLEKGINSNGYLYSSSAPAKLNSTYVLRSIAFSLSPQYQGFFWNTDILVAFKIVGKQEDGSIIFIWKKLKEKDASDLKNK